MALLVDQKNVMIQIPFNLMDAINVKLNVNHNVQDVKEDIVLNVLLLDGFQILIQDYVLNHVEINIMLEMNNVKK
ncbi:unnamed protein product [Paramecium primaurelia]|uniref:Uncharacterized protein n=1 Tax=Paramecium primaurelia TaxID=5886 RepID=A0A8S1K9T3_PARPR|nr:unnamed protein product [Paramecium primaurelia]